MKAVVRHPAYRARHGLSAVPPKYRDYVQACLDLLTRVFGDNLVSVALFGSVARGLATKESDFDVFVVARSLPDSFGARCDLVEGLWSDVRNTAAARKLIHAGSSVLVTPCVLTREETEAHPPVMLDMVEDSVILYDRLRFLEYELKRIARRLQELGSLKVSLDLGRWYWVLKPTYQPGELVRI